MELSSQTEAEAIDAQDVQADDNFPPLSVGGAPGTLEDVPACRSCRKKKAKCSRTQPCTQCDKSVGAECVYDDTRPKGGIRTGAIERLNQRMDMMESMFLGQGVLFHKVMKDYLPVVDRAQRPNTSVGATGVISHCANSLKRTYLDAAAGMGGFDEDEDETIGAFRIAERSVSVAKRNRVDDATAFSNDATSLPDLTLDLTTTSSNDMCDTFPPPKELENILGKYFDYSSPWVPILHMATLFKRVREPSRSPGFSNLLRAIVAATPLHLYAATETHTTQEIEGLKKYACDCRRTVIAAAMNSHTMEATQSLIVIAFDSIKRGIDPSPWPLVAMISRRVVDGQLGYEGVCDGPSTSNSPFSPSPVLKLPQTWIGAEERRRVFWAAFLMDRFCGIATGIRAGIVSDDIRLRLPCDGYMWQQDLAVETEYFKTQEEQNQNDSSNEDDFATFNMASSSSDDRLTGIGGMALTIEASESLYLITQFHNRHKLNLMGPVKVSRWLSKFRQLDSRLLQ